MPTTIKDLPTELLAEDMDAPADWLEVEDVDANETKKIHPDELVKGGGGLHDDDFAGTYGGALLRVGPGAYRAIRHNLSATAAPAVGDDDADGYAVGSLWVNVSTDRAWACVDASTGAAVWLELRGGDVVGPGSAVDGELPVFDGATGKLLKAGAAAEALLRIAGRDTFRLRDSPVASLQALSPAFLDLDLDTSGVTGAAEWYGIRLDASNDVPGAFLLFRVGGTRVGAVEVPSAALGAIFRGGDGDDTNPTFGFESDLDLGFFFASAGVVGLNGALEPNVDGNGSLGTATRAFGNVYADQINGRPVAAPTQVETLAGTTDTLADADNGKVVRCTNAGTVTVTVPTGLTPGTTVEYVQEGAGQVQVAAGAGMTLRHGATWNPYTAEQYSSVVVTILDTDEALVRGDLEAV
ncbi:MAG: hypothetical protein VYE22_09975 [Myxococcota bacterium]|nr:hypothetical protein [Myxococcota bacterium]